MFYWFWFGSKGPFDIRFPFENETSGVGRLLSSMGSYLESFISLFGFAWLCIVLEFEPFGEHIVFPKLACILPQFEWIQVGDYSIPDTVVKKIKLRAFDHFFAKVEAKTTNCYKFVDYNPLINTNLWIILFLQQFQLVLFTTF